MGRGNGELQLSVGGPLVSALGPPIPVPYANVGGRVGATDWLDVGANLNVTGLAYGIWSADFLANFQLYRKPHGLAVAASTRLYTLGDMDDPPDALVLPELGLHLGGTMPRARWLHLYGGMLGTFNFVPPRGRSPAFLTPFMGVEFLLPPAIAPRRDGEKARQHGLALHWAWTNPWDTSESFVDSAPVAGIMAVFVGYRLRFGGLDR